MKTLTKGILGVAITAACAYCGYTTYDSYIYQQENALLLANVEALGQNESGPLGPSECPGPEIYSISGVIDAQLSSKTHKNDSTDVVTVYACKKCVATGSGSLQGTNNLYFDFRYENEREEPCDGKHYNFAIILIKMKMNLSKILATIIMGLIYASCTPSEHLNNIKVELFDSGHSLTFSSFLEGYKIISLSSDTSEAIVHYPDRLLFFDNRIFVMDRGGNKIIMYDRNGKFLKSTAKMEGRGHNEYIRVIDASIDEKTKTLRTLMTAPYQMMIFDLDLNWKK